MYWLYGAAVQSAACADEAHPIPPIASSTRPTWSVDRCAEREAFFPPDALPRGVASSDATTSCFSERFHTTL
nr:hypothetical protein [Pseudoxanthomonas sacheonensis]